MCGRLGFAFQSLDSLVAALVSQSTFRHVRINTYCRRLMYAIFLQESCEYDAPCNNQGRLGSRMALRGAANG